MLNGRWHIGRRPLRIPTPVYNLNQNGSAVQTLGDKNGGSVLAIRASGREWRQTHFRSTLTMRRIPASPHQLLELKVKCSRRKPLDISTCGFVWQYAASSTVVRTLDLASSPAKPILLSLVKSSPSRSWTDTSILVAGPSRNRLRAVYKWSQLLKGSPHARLSSWISPCHKCLSECKVSYRPVRALFSRSASKPVTFH